MNPLRKVGLPNDAVPELSIDFPNSLCTDICLDRERDDCVLKLTNMITFVVAAVQLSSLFIYIIIDNRSETYR